MLSRRKPTRYLQPTSCDVGFSVLGSLQTTACTVGYEYNVGYRQLDTIFNLT